LSLVDSATLGWSQSATETIPAIFRQTSSAATVVANGYRYTATANGFASGFSSSWAKSAVALNEGTVRFYTDTAAAVAVGTDVTPTERARIDSSGNLLVGTTNSELSSTNYGIALRAPSGGTQLRINTAGTTDTNIAVFRVGGSDVFRVATNGGIANFSANNVNLSDRREKTNFAPAGEYLSKICAIQVQTYSYINQDLENDPGLTLGVVAQDVQAVAPELVTESNWGTEEEPKMRLSIYQTDLQYALMKCIQEQQAIITALTARVEALEGAQA
jgi:hypothetical protein